MKQGTQLAAAIAVAAVVAELPRAALAHGDGRHGKAAKASISTGIHAFGVEGDPKQTSRMIAISMDDSMRYTHSVIQVAQGETVTFVISNEGGLLHELVIGTPEELQKHAELMRKHPGMEHDEPYMAHVKPGERESITWKFTQPGTFQFGCLVPGHYEAGMKGTIVVAEDD